MDPAPTLDQAYQALQRYFGFSSLREGQRRVVAGVLAHRDTLVVLPTGGGKSLCYQLPALVLPGLAVVISPLIALMDDQVQALKRRGIPAAALHSGLGEADEAEVWSTIASGQLKLVYLSPERLLADRTLTRLSVQRIALLAIDEAHCVCEWGYDFRPTYLRLVEARRRLRPSVTVALTATATPATRADIIRVLELEQPLVVVSGFDRPNLFFAAERAEGMRERFARIRELIQGVSPAASIVYAGTRNSVESVSQYLRRFVSAVDCYHAGRPAEERSMVQRRFLEGELRVLVATNAFGMGVDKPDVRLVLHLAPPGSIEDYYQEAGRASRDGEPGYCLVLASDSDRHLHERFLAATYPSESAIRARWDELRRAASKSGDVTLPAKPRNSRHADLTSEPDDPPLLTLARYGVVVVETSPVEQWRLRLLVNRARVSHAFQRLTPDARCIAESLIARHQQSDHLALPVGEIPQLDDRTRLRRAVNELVTGRIVHLMPPEVHVRLSWKGERDLPIDWRAHRARAAGERARLDAMHDYVRTQRCRRWFLLRYFGQHHTQAACGDCDNCTQAGSGTHGRQSLFLGTALRGARDGARVRAR